MNDLDANVDCKIYKDSAGNRVSVGNFEGMTVVELVFTSSAGRNAFIKGWEKIFDKEGEGFYRAPGAHDEVIMEVSGNTVKLCQQ